MPKKEKAPKPKKAAAEDAMPAPAATWTCTECGQEHEGEDAAAMECVACGEAKTLTEVTAGADADDKFRGIKCGVVISMEDLGDKVCASASNHLKDPYLRAVASPHTFARGS